LNDPFVPASLKPEQEAAYKGLLHPDNQLEDGVGLSLRPQLLKEFVGQKDIIQNFKVFIESAKKRRSVLDHVLLFGPPGLGKTTLAHLIAKEMGVGFRITSGPVIKRSGELAAILTTLQPFDVLFIDEIHRLNIQIEEILYSAMEDFQLDLVVGEGPGARGVRIDLKPFTLIGATTRSGLLSSPLRDRFGIFGHLQFYDIEELIALLGLAAHRLTFNISSGALEEIAKRCRGTPRIALRLLKRVRDFVCVRTDQMADEELVCYALSQLRVDAYGLDLLDHAYLSILYKNKGPVGIDTLAAALAESSDTIEEVLEPYLLQRGFILKTARGRVLSPEALTIVENRLIF
jgi:holliday junction DNA helicase RuvB